MPTLPHAELAELWQTLDRLLAPDGCPWDREQRPADIARHLIEEGHEWLEACDQNDAMGQVEELGDLAYLLLFGLQRIARDEGEHAAAEVLRGIDAKLRRRHPQLFPAPGVAAGPAPVDSAEQLRVWEAVKREERATRGEAPGLLRPLPRSLSAIARCQRDQETAAGVGFDWPALAGVLAKLEEEAGELREALAGLPDAPPPGAGAPSARYRAALDPAALAGAREEIGDLFIVLTNLSRWLGLDAEALAEGAGVKFRRRFAAMEARLAAEGKPLGELSLETMDRAWQAVKVAEAAEGQP